ncbi:MAG: DUF3160 domain-containing protein [Muribaculaceae bacterium]|nr:DUF3160 domain-containing protein [Muribaculaceae bacterium]
MKRILLFTVVSLLALSHAVAQDAKPSIIIPGEAGIDVETLNENIDFNMDVSKLNVYEIRVLRTALAARQGELVEQADLRRLFDATSWYIPIAAKRAGMVFDNNGNPVECDLPPIHYTAQEQAFIDKLNKAEKDLLWNNIMIIGTKKSPRKGPNLTNLANPMQLENMPNDFKDALVYNGFAIVPGTTMQLFQIYENNDYHEFPSFVTTDLYLQAFHMYFDFMLRSMEEEKMLPVMTDFTKKLYDSMTKKAASSKGNMKEAAQRDAAYFAIAYSLFTGKPLPNLPANYKAMAQAEINHVKAAKSDYSNFLDYKNVMFIYDIYRPRGHYTRSDALQRYFMGMMWLQNAPFGSDKPEQMRAALLMANEIGSNEKYSSIYKSIDKPIAFLMGNADNLGILDIYDIMKADGAGIDKYMTKDVDLNRVKEAIEKKDEQVTRIRPKFERSSHCKINFMPQRYMPDGEVLQEMVDYDNIVTKRDAPKGLDIFAAMGAESALRILINELEESNKWDKYLDNMNRMKTRMGEIDWNSSVANMWMASLQTLTDKYYDNRLPYFMRTMQWEKKSLNASLASWAELKHDAILYAKQPMGAECGGGELPEPYVVGYVEPNVDYWAKAIELLEATHSVLADNGMITDEMEAVTDQMREEAEFFLNVSYKELNGVALTREEYDHIKVIGSTFEYITLQIIGAEPGSKWNNDVNGADKSIALIADVYTANADNNPNKSVLYEAVGPAHEIYVAVEIGGYLYLTRGAVFSYREFQEDIAAPRITDEEWQEDLLKNPDKGIPSWMKELLVPLDGKPVDNEYYFYSTGC